MLWCTLTIQWERVNTFARDVLGSTETVMIKTEWIPVSLNRSKQSIKTVIAHVNIQYVRLCVTIWQNGCIKLDVLSIWWSFYYSFFSIVYTYFLKACLILSELYTQHQKTTHTMSKTPQFYCKMKLYIHNNVISSQNGILFSNDTHKPSYEKTWELAEHWCAQCKTLWWMENTSSPFIIMT